MDQVGSPKDRKQTYLSLYAGSRFGITAAVVAGWLAHVA